MSAGDPLDAAAGEGGEGLLGCRVAPRASGERRPRKGASFFSLGSNPQREIPRRSRGICYRWQGAFLQGEGHRFQGIVDLQAQAQRGVLRLCAGQVLHLVDIPQ